jgi:response regulator RpfG family c-di-GMP phosphodiesterase
MAKLLVVDDEESMRSLLRLNLADIYEIVDTGEPEQALALALEHKPDAVLLDLRMPKYSGFELCKTLTSFSSTQLIPVIVISGEAGSKTKELCRDLGVAAYFEKPVDFDLLRVRLAEFVERKRKERRREVRVHLAVPLRLCGNDVDGNTFDVVTMTENVSLSGFLCSSSVKLAVGSVVDVFLTNTAAEEVGKARIVRLDAQHPGYPKYGCRFVQKVGTWVLQ